MELKLLGTRVVRGRDWKWENQDGGEGCLGTVVQIGQDEKSPFTEQLVWVQWDCGRKANYRAGVQGKYDLRVFESSNQGVRHVHVCCDGCNQDPIVGFRWHCLDCPNYDLCTTCYMTDIHDVTHSFERIDKSRAKGVPVGARQGSIKLEARGMFKGAKVVRGPDWEWKGTDGGTEMEGEVTEITGWSDESTNDAVRVAWKKGPKENLYRLGTNGKVDLKCTVLAVGGSYYRDHLPPLTVEFKTSQSGFTTGDKVCVQQLTAEKLKELSAGHGGWNPDMEKFIRKVGVVQGFTLNGDVVVEYPERRWRYNPAALTKIQNFKRGDEVVIKSDKNLVKDLQDGHGGWNESMISILGRTGAVLEVHNDGDLLVLVDGEQWMLNPAAVTYVTEPEPGQNPESSDDPLGLFTLFRDFLLRQATQGGANIVVAAKTNQVSRVREILDAHPEVINETQDGHTALHVACHEGHCDVITELLDRGADRNILDVQGYTAMHHAAYADKSGEALKLLLEKGFSPNVQHNSNKSSPLHLAVKRDNETAVRILSQCTECNVNLQDTDGDTPLHDAIAGEKHSMVDMLLESPRISMDISNERGFNYLQYAILKGNKQAVEKLLVKAGDVLNVTKSDGFTTLHIAAINDHREIAKMLLNQPGCQVDALTTDNQSSLHVAASEGYSLMVEILLDHGAHVNVVDNDGDTPLHIALAKESFLRTDMMSELPSLQLLFRLTGDSRSYAAVSRCLISYGADVRKRNAKGETPLDRCRGSEVEQLIREIAPFGGTSQNKKVPSFGGRRQSQNREESNNVSSVSSSATQEEATQTVDEEQGTRTGEDNEIQQVEGEDDNNMNHDEQAEQEMNELENQEEKDEQRSDAPPKNENLVTNPVERESSYQEEMNEQENQEEKDNQKTEAVPKDENLVENSLERESSYQENIVVEVTNQAQEMTTDTEFSNNSEIAPDVIAVNNADSANVDIECTALEAQAEGNKECNDQVTENMDEDKPTATEGDDQKPKCQICEENEAVVAFKPCGHTVLCIECAPRLKRCLECKAEITGKGTRDGTPVVGINNKSLVTKYQKLEGKLRKMEESIVCCICVERKKNIIFLCGHGTCHSCAEQLKVCHICQKPIEKKISLF